MNFKISNFAQKFLLLFLFVFTANSQTAPNPILINLQDAINAVKNYHTSPKYVQDMEKIIDDALLNLKQMDIPKNAAFVFDIDETSLSNIEYEVEKNFGYDQASWDKWVEEAKAPAIKATKRFYDSLIKRNIHIIFITGRNTQQYDVTVKNMQKVGYRKYDTIVCKSPIFKGKTAEEYKSQIRKELSNKYKIIGSIGDQWSDLNGGWTILKIKLPNYMYFIK
jgi:acid phosphatase